MSDWPTVVIPVVTSLPSNPYDGQEVHYQADSTNGILWHLRYNAGSASSFKWEFIGGGDLLTVNGGVPVFSHGSGGGTAYADTSCSATAPLGGDYWIAFGGHIISNNAPSYNVWLSPKVAAAAAVDNDAVQQSHGNSTAQNLHGARKLRKTGLSASTAVALNARTDASSVTFLIALEWIALRPIRVS